MHDPRHGSPPTSPEDAASDPPARPYRGRPRVSAVPSANVPSEVPIDEREDDGYEETTCTPPTDESPTDESTVDALPDVTTRPVGRLRPRISDASACVVPDTPKVADDGEIDPHPGAIIIATSARPATPASNPARKSTRNKPARNPASRTETSGSTAADGKRKKKSETELMFICGGLGIFAIVAVVGLAAMLGGDSGSEESSVNDYEAYDVDGQYREDRPSRRKAVESEEFKRARSRRQAWTSRSGGDFMPEEEPPVEPPVEPQEQPAGPADDERRAANTEEQSAPE